MWESEDPRGKNRTINMYGWIFQNHFTPKQVILKLKHDTKRSDKKRGSVYYRASF